MARIVILRSPDPALPRRPARIIPSGDEWLLEEVSERFNASAGQRHCNHAVNGESQDWKTCRRERSGTLAPILSSIDAFERTP
jgi:hypothetical protein